MKTQICKCMLLHAVMLLCVFVAEAQTTDRIKYYIAYDGSGSVAHFDKQRNLFNLFQMLTSYHDSVYNSTASFDLLVYGQSNDKITKNDRLQIDKPENARKLAKRLNEKIAYDRTQLYTHIKPALQQVLADVKANKDVSSGLFIFTDGLLGPNDLNGLEVSTYLGEVKDLLNQLSLNNLPVFIIQSSGTTASYLTNVVDKPSTPSYHAGANFFWASNLISVKDSAVSAAFSRFVYAADQSIVFKNGGPADAVKLAIHARQVMNLMDITKVASVNALSIKNADKGAVGNMLVVLKQLNTLLDASKHSYTADEINTIKATVAHFKGDAAALYQLQDALKAHAAANYATLKQYTNPPDGMLSPFDENRLLAVVDNVAVQPTSMAETQKNAGKTLEESLILGLTDYVIERVKFEAIYAFLDNMHHVLDAKDTGIIKLFKTGLFPNTYTAIQHPEKYSDVLRIKELFQLDMDNLPDNIRKYSSKLVHSEGLVAMLAFYELYKDIVFTGSLEVAFKNLEQSFGSVTTALPNSKMKKGVLFTSRLIGYLTEHDLTKIEPEQMVAFTRLIIALAVDTDNVEKIDMEQAVYAVKETYKKYRLLSAQIKNLNEVLKKDMAGDVEGYRKYQKDLLGDILSKTTSLMLSGNQILQAITYKQGGLDVIQLNALDNTARSCIDAYLHVRDRKYARAGIILAPEIVKCIGTDSDKKDYYKEKMQTLIEVAAEVSGANTADEVKRIISKHAMPVASYRMKRTGAWSVMLTAYPGAGGVIYHPAPNYWEGKLGIMSPVGVEITKSFKCKRSVSLMLSIIDIGNIIDYRLNESNAQNDVVSFQRIVSPGAIFSFGFSQKLPLAFNVGYMSNPARVITGLSFDLPLYALAKWADLKN